MIEFIIALIVALMALLFLCMPVAGFACFFLGEYLIGLLFLLPLLCLLAFLLYRQYITKPERNRMAALSRWYGYPFLLCRKVDSTLWHRGFKKVINDGIVATTDLSKQTDLKRCLQIVEKMAKDDTFNGFHRAFRLTGCHLKIEDPASHSITKIV